VKRPLAIPACFAAVVICVCALPAAAQSLAASGTAPAGDPVWIRTVLWSLLFSVIAGLVELQFRSKAELTSCFLGSSFLYIVLLAFFNTLAAVTAANLLNTKLPGDPGSYPYVLGDVLCALWRIRFPDSPDQCQRHYL
jgi:hypothetical protein